MASHRAAMEDQFLAATSGDGFVGLQVHSCARIDPDGPDGPVASPDAPMTQAHVEYRPQALGASARRVSAVVPDLPIVITENSLATDDDAERVAFTDVSLRGLQAAVADGPTSAATSTGACWTTSSGSPATAWVFPIPCVPHRCFQAVV